MLFRKPIIIVLTLFIITIFVALFFVRSRPQPTTSVPTPSPTPYALLAPPLPPGGGLPAPTNVSFTMAPTSFTPPVFTQHKISTDAVAVLLKVNDFAKSQGFGVPTVNNSGDETIRTWSLPGALLTYSQTKDQHVMSHGRYDEGLPPIDNSIAGATNVLRSLLLLPPELTLIHTETQTDLPHGGTWVGVTKLTTYGFSVLLGGAPLLLANYDPASLRVSIDQNGRLRTLTVIFPPTTLAPLPTSEVLSGDSVVKSLSQNLGALLYSFAGSGEYGAEPDFSSVRITGISPAYAIFSNVLTPVYLVDGQATGGDSPQKVRYVLRATAN